MDDRVDARVDIEALTDRFFRRAEAGDVDGMLAMCRHDVVVTRNDDRDGDRESLRRHAAGVVGRGMTVTYSEVRRVVTSDTVVEQHLGRMRHPDGREAVAAVCMVLRFDELGSIARIDEYVDPAPFIPLFT